MWYVYKRIPEMASTDNNSNKDDSNDKLQLIDTDGNALDALPSLHHCYLHSWTRISINETSDWGNIYK